MDMGVSLTSLIGESPAPATEVAGQAASSPAQHLRNQSNASSSEGFSECGMGSPTPASRSGRTLLRHSMVRYSQDRSRPQPRRRGPSTQSAYDDSESELEGPVPAPDELTSSSFTHSQSSHATNVSISSLHSSPCPAPRSRRIPMLTRRTPVIPDFHFPPVGAGDSSANPTIRGPSGGGSPWTQTHSSSSPSKAQQQKSSASPFKRLFNPLEEFRARSSGKRNSGSASEEDSTGEIQLQEALGALT